MSSIGSDFSDLSVSVFGEDDVPIEQALDQVFKELQESLNNCHCEVRTMAMDLERANGDFKISYAHHVQIEDYIDGFSCLFKELKSVSKQILPKPDKDQKMWYQEQQLKRKLQKMNAKKNAAAKPALPTLTENEEKTD